MLGMKSRLKRRGLRFYLKPSEDLAARLWKVFYKPFSRIGSGGSGMLKQRA